MSNKKYNKFIVGAASAALVATAVAPVASAKDFSDTKGNTHQPAIDALSNAGVISGYPDGSFKPNKTLTRSDVVKLMGKWLVAKGYKIPTDYKTNMRFTDLTSKSNDELLQSAAIVKEYGVFNGSNGRLLAGDNITRENMAVVIVRAFDTVEDLNLVSFVAAQDFKKDVTDLSSAKAEARTAIDVLDYFDITNPAAPKFNPKNTTTRGQFATFLQKSIDTDFSAAKGELSEDQKAVNEIAKALKTSTVQVSNGDNATADAKLAAVKTFVDKLAVKNDMQAIVIEGTKANEFKVTLTKGKAKAEETMTITFDYAATDRFVTSVKAINAKQVEVKFSTKIDATEAEKHANYLFTVLDGQSAPTPTAAVLQEDEKTVIVTVTNELEKRYQFSLATDKIAATDGTKINYNETVTFAKDTAAPTITGTERLSSTKVKVKFSEPVEYAAGNISAKYADNSSTLDNTKVKIDSTGLDTAATTAPVSEVTLDLADAAVAVNKDIVVSFNGVKDTAGNLISPQPSKVTVVKNTADTVAPKLAAVTQTGAKSFTIKFDKATDLTPFSANGTEVAVTGAAVTEIKKVSASEYKITVDTVLSGIQTVTVKSGKATNLDGATTSTDLTKLVTFTSDQTAPKATAKLVKNSNNVEMIELTFDKDVTVGQVTVTGKQVKNSITTSVNATATAVHPNSANKKVLHVPLAATLAVDGAVYDVTVSSANIKSDADKAMEDVKVQFTRGKDVPSNTNVLAAADIAFAQGANNDEVTVTFSNLAAGTRELDYASAAEVANYAIDGVQIESASLAAMSGTTQVVTLKLKADSNTFTGVHNAIVKNVKLSGSTKVMNPVTKVTPVLVENVRPVVVNAALTANDVVTLTFSKDVKGSVDLGKDSFLVKAGMATVAQNAAGATIDPTNAKKVNIKLNGSLSQEQLATTITVEPSATTANFKVVDLKGNKLEKFNPVNVVRP